MKYTLDVNIDKIKKDAEDLYGPLYCSEAIMRSIHRNFKLDLPDEVIAMASAFPVGIGGSMCLCGAVSGGVMALGLFFGRSEPGDPKINKVMTLGAELHEWFKSASGKGALCCRIITKDVEMGSKEHIDQCTFLTGLVAGKVAEIIVRELRA